MARRPNHRGTRFRYQVRRATLRDVKELVRQRRGMWLDMGLTDLKTLDKADRAYARWVRSSISNGSVIGWIVETSEGVVAGGGCLWLRPAQPRPRIRGLADPYLLSMFTDPRFRGMGVASLIVKEAIKWCQRRGYGRIWLHASEKGRRVYRRFGFTRTWEMRLEIGKTNSEARE